MLHAVAPLQSPCPSIMPPQGHLGRFVPLLFSGTAVLGQARQPPAPALPRALQEHRHLGTRHR